MIIQSLTIVLLLFAASAATYYLVLALFSIRNQPDITELGTDPQNTFAIVIPAHNEEEGIADVVKACSNLDYPKAKFDMYVIADNCVDRTAQISKDNGALCLERHDPTNRGKGQALQWAFEHILPAGHDAIVVIDADCYLDSQALRVFDKYLEAGKAVLQANDATSNLDDNVINYAVAVGNLIENKLFYAPKDKLGLAVFLRGTGMVFKRDVLLKYPWKAHSVAEDVEYALNLIRNKITIYFVEEVHVTSEFPSNVKQLNTQRLRWASGNLKFSKTYSFKLIWEGIRQRNITLVDAGWSLLVLSRPLVLLELLVALLLGILCYYWIPGPLSYSLLFAGVAVLIMQGLYFAAGIWLFGLNRKRLKLLLFSPFVIVKLMVISLFGLMGVKQTNWARTPRN